MSLPDAPNTLREKYYSVMAGQNDADILPDIETAPSTENMYLDYIARNGGGGGGDDEVWLGTRAEHTAAETAGTIPETAIIGITDESGSVVQSDWNQTDSTADDYIKNKPTIPDITGKADKVSSATSGNFAGLDSNGNLTDSGKTATDFATANDVTNKQDKITQSATLTLTVAGWDSTLKTQTVTFAHDTSKRNVIDITVSELEDWAACGVVATGETASGISFKCEEIPESALTFTVCSMSVASAN